MEDQDFMARLAQLGGCRLLCAPLWEKHRSDDALSGRWKEAGHWLIRYSQANPDYLVRYRKLGSYFATKVLCYDLRRPSLATFLRDLHALTGGTDRWQCGANVVQPPRGESLPPCGLEGSGKSEWSSRHLGVMEYCCLEMRQ